MKTEKKNALMDICKGEPQRASIAENVSISWRQHQHNWRPWGTKTSAYHRQGISKATKGGSLKTGEGGYCIIVYIIYLKTDITFL